ncbi:MAG: amino acid adenylation domain-containing protein, partial [Verrucomicrobia bacterium]|nr:amino acid adenylation domain-containing protein [Verrucomicrobiota bacterium]
PMSKTPQESVVQRLFDFASRNPEHPAVSQGEFTCSYQQLTSRVLELAAILRESGIQPNDRVLIEAEKSFGGIVSLLGTLAVGGVMVPVDPELPEKRKQQMLEKVGAKYLLQDGALGSLNWWRNPTVSLIHFQVDGSTGSVLAQHTKGVLENILFKPQEDSPAYVFFTSGSTGTPKAILGRYEGLNHFINWQRKAFKIGPNDRVSQLTSLSFDVSLRDIFLPLASGATLCLPPEGLLLLDSDTLSWLKDERISVVHTVPSIIEVWLQRQMDAVDELPDLRWTFSAGEPLGASLVGKWRAIARQSEIVNLYGPTETTLAKCWYKVPSYPTDGIQPIGEALPNSAVMIMSSDLRPAGIGELGEIVIRTPYTSLGYLEESEENEKAFVQNPYLEDPQDVLYRSGDLGRLRPDGVIEILGRLDDQIKIRGVRIEPRSIELVLDSYPGIDSCRVIGTKDKNGESSLVAYAVTSSGISHVELREHLSSTLPQSMIPSAFVFLDKLPLTVNGKLDKKALPEPEFDRQNLDTQFVASRNELEEHLTRIFRDLLGVNNVGIHDNFFNLGGNSLKAVRLCYKIKEQIGKSLRVASVFESPTVAQLSRILKDDQEKSKFSMLLAGEGEGVPIFFIPGISRTALVLSKMAKRLDAGRPCFGLELPPSENGNEPLNTLEELAAHCVSEIRTIQPAGPYTLVGFSFGGLLAYETARQLNSIDQSVPKVFMFDSFHRSPVDQPPLQINRLKWVGQMLISDKHRFLGFFIKNLLLHHLFRRFGIFSNRKTHRDIFPELGLEGIVRLKSNKFHYNYQPKPFALDLTVFSVRQTLYTRKGQDEVLRWNDYSTEEVKYPLVNTDFHLEILDEKHLDNICQRMRKDMEGDKSKR